MGGKNFWYSTHVSRDDQEPTARGLQDGNAERLGQAGVQEYVATAQHVPHLIMRQSSQ